MGKRLIINADDYGLSREVNDAIGNLITAGRLKSVSVLANSLFFDEAAAFLAGRDDCSVGIHLNVVEGISLLAPERVAPILGKNGQFAELSSVLSRWLTSPRAVARAVEMEWREQIEHLLASGRVISHADSHQHIHAFPPFWRIIVRLCREYNISAVRLPRERNRVGRRRAAAFALAGSATVAMTLSPAGGLVVNDHFLGLKRAGAYGEAEMINDLGNLKEGLTELIIHPSLYDGVPHRHMNGELEHRALLGAAIWEHIAGSDIELVNWADAKGGAVGV